MQTLVGMKRLILPSAALFFPTFDSAKCFLMSNGATKTKGFSFKKIVRYFIQGIIVLAPIGITGYVLYWLFDKVDGILQPYVKIPGLGFAIILVFVVLV